MAKVLSERKQREFDLRRTYIIDKAEKLFYKYGYESVTLNQLAEAVHYTKATLYTYLSCKDEIYLEVYCRGFAKRTEYLYQNMKHCDTGFEEVDEEHLIMCRRPYSWWNELFSSHQLEQSHSPYLWKSAFFIE